MVAHAGFAVIPDLMPLADFHEQFPDADLIRIWTRVRLYQAAHQGQPCLILDDGGIDQHRQPAVKVFIFEHEADRAAYLDQKYPYQSSTDPALSFDERLAAAQPSDRDQKSCRFCEG